MILNGRGKHKAHLCCHKCQVQLLTFHILVHAHQIHTHVARNDIDTTAYRSHRIDIHHVGIESEVSISYSTVLGRYIECFHIPMTEIDNVTVLQYHALRGSRRT